MAYDALEELAIFRLAERICDRIYDLVNAWSVFDKNTTGCQLVRAADSIGANIAESYGRYHYGERIQFLYYARGSLYETRFWLRRAKQRQLIAEDVCEKAIATLDDFAKSLNAYIREKREQRTNNRLSEAGQIYNLAIHDDDAEFHLDDNEPDRSTREGPIT